MTLDTVADESRKKMANGVTRSPGSALQQRRGSFGTVDALSTIFLLLCVTSYLAYFSFLSPVCFSS